MEQVKLLHVPTNNPVVAELLPLSSKHLDDVETYWKNNLELSVEEDSHWQWQEKFEYTNSPNYERYAIECQKITQGLMILEIDLHRSRLDPHKNLVYVEYLATAPWNRKSLQNPPEYKGIGSLLLGFAINLSIDLEYKGRLGLHSLPNARPFYKKIGMIDLGCDPDYGDLTYFEMEKNGEN